MDFCTINAIRNLVKNEERRSALGRSLYQYETEFLESPEGVSVVIPIHNGADEMKGLLHSLAAQEINNCDFEIIFSLNGCTDDTALMIQQFCLTSSLSCVVIESEESNISRARNLAIEAARFRYTTFVDHDDTLSCSYLKELVHLGDDRSVVVSNIMRIEDGRIESDYAQQVIAEGFTTSNIHCANEIGMCFRAYTLNAIKLAPTYMIKRVRYDESLPHCEDILFWREIFHSFLPITVKTPGWRDVYYRTVRHDSASRRLGDLNAWALPRLKILDILNAASFDAETHHAKRIFDRKLSTLLRDTLAWHGCPVATAQ